MVAAIDQAIFITERIEQCYEAATRLFGNRYYEKTQPIRDAMQDLKNKTGCNNIEAGMAVMNMLIENGPFEKGEPGAMAIMMISAVIFDMSRESEAGGVLNFEF